MPNYSAEAIVLRKSNFGEADQILTLLTRYRGKVSAVAKGIRRTTSRKGGNLDLLNLVKAYLAEGKNLDIITEVELISAWPSLKSDLERVALGYQLAELANGVLTESQESRAAFDLSVETLKYLEVGSKPELMLRGYQVKLLGLVGFEPQLERCIRCGLDLPQEGLAVSPALGGVIGPEERAEDPDAWAISAAALKAWRFLQKEPLDKIAKLNISSEVASELARSLQYYLEYLLERKLKSAELLRSVRSLRKSEG